MITIGEMQISGMLTMMMLSVMLMACVPNRSTHRSCFARARWMMAAGTGLIAVQFLLQYIFGFSSREYFHRTFRQMTGSTPANYQ
jgi:methylphosphotriester-DNA--protein-cysteine methyltransferase